MSEQVTSTRGKKNEMWEWVQALAIAIGLATIIRVFIFSPFIVEGHSMDYTLDNGERLVVNKAIYYLRPPAPGDIIVFHAEETKDYIKRVIATAGDTVEVRDDVLYVNSKAVPEPYLEKKHNEAADAGILPLTEEVAPVKVPEGHIFVMGDNRQNSRDSREIGPVNIDTVVGRAEFIFWPLKDIGMTR